MGDLLKRLSSQDLDEFSRGLARELAASYTLEMSKGGSDKKVERKLRRALDRVYAKAMDYHADRKLGVYGKARLGNTFKWELKEMGYGDDFADEATRGLVVSLSRV